MSYVLEIHMETFTDAMRWCLWFVSSNLEGTEKLDGSIDEKRCCELRLGAEYMGVYYFCVQIFPLKVLKIILGRKAYLQKDV